MRKGWARFVIIDFALARVDHRCAGWTACEELVEARRALGLEGIVDVVVQLQGTVKEVYDSLRLLFALLLIVLLLVCYLRVLP